MKFGKRQRKQSQKRRTKGFCKLRRISRDAFGSETVAVFHIPQDKVAKVLVALRESDGLKGNNRDRS